MLQYIAGRVFSGLITIWFLATITFFAMNALPGSPFDCLKAKNKELCQSNSKKHHGLEGSLGKRYGIFLSQLVQGDLGESLNVQKGRPVVTIISERFAVSAKLGLIALIFAVSGGILLGAIAASFPKQTIDTILMLLITVLIAVPGFVIAIWVRMWWGVAASDNLDISAMLIPALVLGLGTMAYIARLMRTSMLEIAKTAFVRTAHAKGLSHWRIFYQHLLRNALLPIITILGPLTVALTTGSIVIEDVFAIPGLGQYFVKAIQSLDYNLIQGTTLFYGTFLVIAVLVVDIAYGMVNPQIRIKVKR